MIRYTLAQVLRIEGAFMLLPCIVALIYREQAGIIYHREGIMGDYDDFDDLEKLIEYIKSGKREA